MTSRLSLSLPVVVDVNMTERSLVQVIKDAILTFQNNFIPRMAQVCTQYDLRADYCEGSLAVEDISFDSLETNDDDELVLDITGNAEVTYDWYAHYGCKDMCGGDQLNDSWEFHLQGSELNFSLEIPEERDTHEEF